MKNAKVVIVSAVCGFILSFFFGLFSHSKFIRIFLIALLAALIFAVLGMAISFIYSKFLAVDNYANEVGESTASVSSGNSKTAGAHSATHKVDIVIAESDLEQTGNSNHYDVGNHKQMLNDSDVKVNNTDNSIADSGFVPLRSLETVSNFSGTEAVSSSSISGKTSEKQESSVASMNISATNSVNTFKTSTTSGMMDELPDMGDISFTQSNSGADDSEILSDNSDFISSALKYKDDNNSNIQDASLMAKAISSILSEET